MISDYTIFCVGCSSVVDKEKAERIFRTGFYKVSMRLGICIVCENKDRQLEQSCMIDPTNQLEVFIDDRAVH
jgi:hypothetical protein